MYIYMRYISIDRQREFPGTQERGLLYRDRELAAYLSDGSFSDMSASYVRRSRM